MTFPQLHTMTFPRLHTMTFPRLETMTFPRLHTMTFPRLLHLVQAFRLDVSSVGVLSVLTIALVSLGALLKSFAVFSTLRPF
jgi:hypothetical protein